MNTHPKNTIGVSKNSGIPKLMVYNGKPFLKWMIGGKTHYFRKHPNRDPEFRGILRNPMISLHPACDRFPFWAPRVFSVSPSWTTEIQQVETSQDLPNQSLHGTQSCLNSSCCCRRCCRCRRRRRRGRRGRRRGRCRCRRRRRRGRCRCRCRCGCCCCCCCCCCCNTRTPKCFCLKQMAIIIVRSTCRV